MMLKILIYNRMDKKIFLACFADLWSRAGVGHDLPRILRCSTVCALHHLKMIARACARECVTIVKVLC